MYDSQKDFKQAWNDVISKGNMCLTESPSFKPVGIRKNVKEKGPLYHGTKADLKIGDFIIPGFPSNYGTRENANFVYATAIQEGAALAAQLALGEGASRIFIVEPTGPIEDDPNVTDQKFPGNPSRSYRTREPLKVIGEVSDWKHLDPNVLEKIQKQIQQASQLGIQAINK